MLAFSHRVRRAALVVACLGLASLVVGRAPAANETSEERLRQDITVLASEEYQGRGVTTPGINKAADYIVNVFKQAGLKPGAKDGYFQPFTMPGATLGKINQLVLVGPKGEESELKLGQHFQVHGMSHGGEVRAPVVFVGYGVSTAPPKQGEAAAFSFDDYQGMDVAGKVVIVLRDTPRAGIKNSSFDGNRRREHASFTRKMQNALRHKAAAILFVNDHDTARDGDVLLDFGYTATAPSPSKLPALHVRRGDIDAMLFSSLGVHLDKLEKDIDRDLKPHSAALTGWEVRLTTSVQRGAIGVKNVVGVLEGHGDLAQETVVLGAHYDHLGLGGASSLAGLKKPTIHHGADDNGSGTTALLELARRFGQQPRDGKPRRRLVFLAFSGEESGLLGSAFYTKNPLFPLDRTVAMVNMDMIGRLRPDTRGAWASFLTRIAPLPAAIFPALPLAQALQPAAKDFLDPKDKLIVHGTGTAKNFDRLIDSLNTKYGFRLQKVPGGIGPSDHASFCLKKIPVFFFFTGDHPDYHRPSDTADKINIAGMRKITDLVQDVVSHLLTTPERPEYVQLKESGPARPEGRIPRIGIRPDYGDDQDGVLLAGVTPGGPADQAGLQEGDRIVAIGDKPVKDLKAYMALLANHKPGQPLELSVLHAGKTRAVKVKPE